MAKAKPVPAPEIGVLFRYRNLSADTLEEHKKMIASKGSCWWGWWKRPREPRRREVWDLLQEKLKAPGGVWVGLFDSGGLNRDRSVYLARITEVVPPLDDHLPEGSPPLPSNEQELVPEYYRNSPFSRAWLRIAEIRDEPLPFFGHYSYTGPPPLLGIPPDLLGRLANKVVKDDDELRTMDTTIWLVRPKRKDDHDEKFLAPSVHITAALSIEPIRVDGDTILHLTDLHFATGRNRDQHAWGYPTEDPKAKTLAEAVGQAATDKKVKKVGIIVISGDFTFIASDEEFDEAYKSINALLGTLGLGADNLVIIPGNHDIAWSKPDGENYNASTPVQSAPDEAKLAYKKFYKRLMKHTPNDDFSMGRRFILPSGITVDICALNSSSLEQGKDYLSGMGLVRPSSFNDVMESLQWRKYDKSFAFRILAVHHHLTATEDVESADEFSKGFGMAIDAKRILRDAARYGVHLVLHGHRHRVFVWREGVYQPPDQPQHQHRWKLGDVSILGGGSSGSTSVEGDRRFMNLITVTGTGLEVEILRSMGRYPFEMMHTWRADFALRDGRLQLGDWQDPV
jgi:predicted phosphodiesterase